MNPVLYQKCEQPEFFSSVRYYIHSLETEQINTILKEIFDINPYLATLTYLSSDDNESFKNFISNQNRNEFKDKDLKWLVSYALALDAIHDKNTILDVLKLCVRNDSEHYNSRRWVELNDYWAYEFKKMLFSGNYISFWNRYRLVTQLRESSTYEENDMPIVADVYQLKEYYKTGKWAYFLYWLELEDLYSHLPKIDSIDSIFNKMLNYISQSADSDFKKRELIDAARKITILYLKDTQINKEQIKTYRKIMFSSNTIQPPTKSSSNKEKYYFEIYNIILTLNTSGHKEFFEDMYFYGMWDESRNMLPRPYSTIYKFHDVTFWKCNCGYSWKESLNSIHRRVRRRGFVCPICQKEASIHVLDEKVCAWFKEDYFNHFNEMPFHTLTALYQSMDFEIAASVCADPYKLTDIIIQEFQILDVEYYYQIFDERYGYDATSTRAICKLLIQSLFRNRLLIDAQQYFNYVSNSFNKIGIIDSSFIPTDNLKQLQLYQSLINVAKGFLAKKDDTTLLFDNNYVLNLWDEKGNGFLKPYQAVFNIYDYAHWRCRTCGHSWTNKIYNILTAAQTTNKSVCPICKKNSPDQTSKTNTSSQTSKKEKNRRIRQYAKTQSPQKRRFNNDLQKLLSSIKIDSNED